MPDKITGREKSGRWRRLNLHLDWLLLLFLVAGWLLIFGSATLGLQRSGQEWLPLKLVPLVSADYGVDTAQALRLAPVRPQIVEAVKQDALVARPVPSPVALADATPTSILKLIFGATPTPTLTLVPSPLPTPLIVSAGGPYIGNEGSPVILSARVTADVASGPISYSWDLDKDGLYDDAVGISTSFIFYDEGDYPIGVQASDQRGWVTSDITMVRVMNVAPIVNAGRDTYTDEGRSVAFSGAVSDPGHDVLFYYWDFGDGSEVEEATLHPRHTYTNNGEYHVTLHATDNDGGDVEASLVTYVGNLEPLADAGPDQVSNEGESVTFHGSATDPGALDKLTYDWDMNYDGVTFTSDLSGPDVSTTYGDGPATFRVALRVQDEDGGQAIDTANVVVDNVAPTILGVRNDGPVGEGSPMTLVVDAADVVDDALTYAFDWQNDGIFDDVNQPASVSHVWPDEGDYTVGVLADDGDGGQVFAFTTVSAVNVPPSAVAGPVVASLEGSSVTFNGGGSSDPGTADALTYLWDFGDGSPVATGAVVTHAYPDNNVYTTTLTVTDDSGEADTDAVAVTILNANPVADAGLSELVVNEGSRFDLTGSATDPGAADTHSFAWDFDFNGVDFSEDASGLSVNIGYPDGPATPVLALRVRDDDYPYPGGGGGEIGEGIDTVQVTVNNVPPAQVDAGGPYYGHQGQSIRLSGSATDVPADPLGDGNYTWDLDNNGTFETTGQIVNHTWAVTGTYTVVLRVDDFDGGRTQDTARVTITNRPPSAEAGGPYPGSEGVPVVLTGSGTDPDNDPLTYTWDLDYDSVFETPGQVVTYTWPDNGIYTVTLRVDDGWGGVATDTASVQVANVPPSANAGGPYTTNVNVPLTLTGSGTDVASDPLTFAWDLDNNGTFETPGRIVNYTWTAIGTYTVELQVDDGDGGRAQDTAQVIVANRPPSAQAGGPYAGSEGVPIVLTGSGIDPDNDPLIYTWDLDYDGVFETPGQVVAYTWPDNGNYTVVLRVDDGRGGVATDIASVQVANVPPSANAGGPYTTGVSVPVTLTGSGSDVASDPLTFDWDLDNDGTFETPGQIVDYTWTVTGTYTVVLQVDDGDGGVTTNTTSVDVNILIPIGWPGVSFLLRLRRRIFLRR